MELSKLSGEPGLERQHIEITPGVCGGRARIAGHRIRVQDIVLYTEQGQSPDEIASAYPGITLSDVHAALAYYFDRREAIDREIRDDALAAEQFQSQFGGGPLSIGK